jgi:hypothetical protein
MVVSRAILAFIFGITAASLAIVVMLAEPRDERF